MIAILLIIIFGCLGVLFVMFGVDGLKKHTPKIPFVREKDPDINEDLHPL